MVEPRELYTVAGGPRAGENPVLLHALSGFLDAGSVAQIVTDRLLADAEQETVVTFDADRLVDYRARRPRMRFDRDHWAGYEPPHLVVRRVLDADGQPFLLLTGPEPDRYWDAVAAALVAIVEEFDVRLTVGYQGVPMAVPHTRPIGITAHGTDPSVLPAGSGTWWDSVDIPGSVGALLEYRLGEAGHPALGFAVHVPHYLASAQFAEGALHAMESVAGATGLKLPLQAMVEAAEAEREAIATEVAESAEVAGVVTALEQQYDQFADAAGRSDLPPVRDVDLPSVDELAEQVEDFLRAHETGDGPDSDGR